MNKTSKTNMLDTFENVSILQGGCSLGTFGCGVFKALAKGSIRFDISQALQLTDEYLLIAGSKEDHPDRGNFLAMTLIV